MWIYSFVSSLITASLRVMVQALANVCKNLIETSRFSSTIDLVYIFSISGTDRIINKVAEMQYHCVAINIRNISFKECTPTLTLRILDDLGT
jgi:hypothetical protein